VAAGLRRADWRVSESTTRRASRWPGGSPGFQARATPRPDTSPAGAPGYPGPSCPRAPDHDCPPASRRAAATAPAPDGSIRLVPAGVAIDGDDFGAVDEPADHGDGDHVVADDFAPGHARTDLPSAQGAGWPGCHRVPSISPSTPRRRQRHNLAPKMMISPRARWLACDRTGNLVQPGRSPAGALVRRARVRHRRIRPPPRNTSTALRPALALCSNPSSTRCSAPRPSSMRPIVSGYRGRD
jgi:hypothetical protein